jgi:hypothetical protein
VGGDGGGTLEEKAVRCSEGGTASRCYRGGGSVERLCVCVTVQLEPLQRAAALGRGNETKGASLPVLLSRPLRAQGHDSGPPMPRLGLNSQRRISAGG